MSFSQPLRAFPLILGLAILVTVAFWPGSDAAAQCGSQASSCKNCHEVQGQDPVNNDGTSWHTAHAFGDFCYICHAGNNQSLDINEAHAGMVPPLSDVKAACQSCHPGDLEERAEVYAVSLGVEVGMGGTGTASEAAVASGESSTGGVNFSSELIVPEGAEIIDYNLRYAGITPVNWGNVILAVLVGMVAVGGGTYVYTNERKLRGLPILPKRKQSTPEIVQEDWISSSMDGDIEMLIPMLVNLDPAGRHALRKLLQNPEQASRLLQHLSKLDPELVRRISSLNANDRALLLALAD